MNCESCRAETTNGLALCDLCQHKAKTDLEFLPIYFRNLARWRPPARPNGSLGGPGQWLIRRGESEGSRIGNALERSVNDLTTWARALADDRVLELPDADTEAETVVVVCEWLAERLTTIATLEWAGQFVADIDRHETALRGLTEAAVPGWYAGLCRRCEVYPTYVVPGLTWVTCGGCGATTYARDHLATVINEARDWIARPMRIAEATVALIDTELSVPRLHKRISKWGERDRIDVIRAHDYAPKRFRFGDVLDALATDGATPLGELLDEKAS